MTENFKFALLEIASQRLTSYYWFSCMLFVSKILMPVLLMIQSSRSKLNFLPWRFVCAICTVVTTPSGIGVCTRVPGRPRPRPLSTVTLCNTLYLGTRMHEQVPTPLQRFQVGRNRRGRWDPEFARGFYLFLQHLHPSLDRLERLERPPSYPDFAAYLTARSRATWQQLFMIISCSSRCII